MKQIYVVLLMILIGIQSYCVLSYKILGIFPTVAPSHYNVGKALMKGLAAAGHDVTIVSPFKEKNQIKNYREVVVRKIRDERVMGDHDFLAVSSLPMYKKIGLLFRLGVNICNSTITDNAFQQLLRSSEKFDVVIVELFMTESLLAAGHNFDASVIGVSTFGASKMSTDTVGAPEIASYIPNVFTGFSDRMTYKERLINWMRNSFEDILNPIFYIPMQQELLQYYPKKNVPSIKDLKRNVSFVLLNSHVTFGFPRPYPPNMVEVGGLHIDHSMQSLPENIKRFLDNAKDGVIYFSMGSNIQFSTMPENKKLEVLNALKSFSKLRMLIKSDTNLTVSSHKSRDVIVSNWFPQQAILAHPNVKLFITHGGLLSTIESVYFGKPMVGIPVFGDQHLNMRMATFKGYGEGVPYEDLNEILLKETLEKVLLNPSYAENARVLSERYRDQIKTPLETAVFWVEYVARHKGAYHLRSAAVDLPFYVYNSYDIYFFLIFVFLLIRFAVKKVLSITHRNHSQKKKAPKQKKQ